MIEQSNFEIPSEILAEAQKYFSPVYLELAKKLLLFSKVNLSFSKGSPDSYFIVTGLVNDLKKHESKIFYTKRSFERSLTTLLIGAPLLSEQ